jgi:copper homeostasis protein
MPRLEVCIDSVESAVAAQAGGAARLEICDSLVEGGTTPSIGKLICCLRHVSIPVHAMLRPRGGDFLYSAAEQEVILEDASALKEAGAHGIVFGALRADGTADEPLLRAVIARVAPLPVTFHRAIDVSADSLAVLDVCRRCGVARILTSGGATEAMNGSANLRLLVAAAGDALQIAAGGGVSADNGECSLSDRTRAYALPTPASGVVNASRHIPTSLCAPAAATLLRNSGVDELHGSLRTTVPSAMQFRPKVPIYMGADKINTPSIEFELRVTDAERVKAVVAVLGDGSSERSP